MFKYKLLLVSHLHQIGLMYFLIFRMLKIAQTEVLLMLQEVMDA